MLEHTNMREQITKIAKNLGFDLVGFSKAQIDDRYLKGFEKWLSEGNAGTMSYMEKIEKRRDLSLILPSAKSVIVLATNYFRPQSPPRKGHGIVARYAYGRDYHKIIGKKLRQLEAAIKELAPHTQTKSYVDTGPVLERALAEQAGLGRIGKNTCLITPEFGSWVFLSEIITTLDLVAPTRPRPARWSSGPAANVCGNCTRCIDACPTGAIIRPGVIDARLCISYLTIENKDKIPPALAKIIAKTKRVYGCDICQEVCPHNEARQKTTTHTEFTDPVIAGDQISSRTPATKSDEHYLCTFAGSPFMRIKRKGLKRNLKLLEGVSSRD